MDPSLIILIAGTSNSPAPTTDLALYIQLVVYGVFGLVLWLDSRGTIDVI